jgi:hypothetical protein
MNQAVCTRPGPNPDIRLRTWLRTRPHELAGIRLEATPNLDAHALAELTCAETLERDFAAAPLDLKALFVRTYRKGNALLDYGTCALSRSIARTGALSELLIHVFKTKALSTPYPPADYCK